MFRGCWTVAAQMLIRKITALDYFDGGADSPFKSQLKWPKNEDGFIAPNALESGLSEVQNRSALLGVQDLEIDTFTGIWAAIKDAWPKLWNPDTHLLEKACSSSTGPYIYVMPWKTFDIFG